MNIQLRKWTMEDVNSMAAAANNEEVSKYLRDVFTFPYTPKDAEAFIRFCVEYDGKDCLFAVTVDGKVIGGGNIGYRDDVNSRSVGIGYWLGKEYWGQGIGTQVIKKLCDIAFQDENIVRIDADIIEENEGSKKVLINNGFRLEGTLQKAIYKRGRFYNGQIYAKVR